MTSATSSKPSTASIGDPVEAAVRANLIRADGHQLDPLIIGVDPGISGALVLLDPATMRIWKWSDMPVIDAGGKRSVSASMLAITIAEWRSLAEACGRRLLAIVEEVGAMPGQGVTSMFNFGRSYGLVIGVLAANSVPTEFARPAVWKRGAGISKDKGRARKTAQERFPVAASVFVRVKDDGRAEAALLAMWRAEKGNK